MRRTRRAVKPARSFARSFARDPPPQQQPGHAKSKQRQAGRVRERGRTGGMGRQRHEGNCGKDRRAKGADKRHYQDINAILVPYARVRACDGAVVVNGGSLEAAIVSGPDRRGDQPRAGNPAARRAACASATECLPKWKIEAASTALACPSTTPATR